MITPAVGNDGIMIWDTPSPVCVFCRLNPPELAASTVKSVREENDKREQKALDIEQKNKDFNEWATEHSKEENYDSVINKNKLKENKKILSTKKCELKIEIKEIKKYNSQRDIYNKAKEEFEESKFILSELIHLPKRKSLELKYQAKNKYFSKDEKKEFKSRKADGQKG